MLRLLIVILFGAIAVSGGKHAMAEDITVFDAGFEDLVLDAIAGDHDGDHHDSCAETITGAIPECVDPRPRFSSPGFLTTFRTFGPHNA